MITRWNYGLTLAIQSLEVRIERKSKTGSSKASTKGDYRPAGCHIATKRTGPEWGNNGPL